MTADTTTPGRAAGEPHFSSGPCAKRPGWTPEALKMRSLGRSHRAKAGKAKLKQAIDLTREILEVPADYRDRHRAGLRHRRGRDGDVVAARRRARRHARLGELRRRLGDRRRQAAEAERRAHPQGRLRRIADLARSIPTHDVVFTWNGTTSGVRVPNGDWIAADREGMTICDATSAAFAQDLDWPKLDVVTFSWQKVLGGEAAHGMLILSPRAVARLESYTPPWPLPKIFRMTKGGKLIEGIFEGETINTPSMLCVEDYLDALQWAKSIGGLDGADRARRCQLQGRSRTGSRKTPWVDFLAKDPATRSNTCVCLKVVDPAVTALPADAQAAFAKKLADRAREGGRRPRHRRLSRRAAGPAHLVRRDRGERGRRGADALARLGLREARPLPRRRDANAAKRPIEAADRSRNAAIIRARVPRGTLSPQAETGAAPG